MSKLKYEIVQHDGGWAYRVDGAFSETFPSHDEAVEAANIASREQELTGQSEPIEWQDSSGKWHREMSDGDDRPETSVEDTDE